MTSGKGNLQTRDNWSSFLLNGPKYLSTGEVTPRPGIQGEQQSCVNHQFLGGHLPEAARAQIEYSASQGFRKIAVGGRACADGDHVGHFPEAEISICELGFRKMAAAISICARAASRSHFPEAPGSRKLNMHTRGLRKMAAAIGKAVTHPALLLSFDTRPRRHLTCGRDPAHAIPLTAPHHPRTSAATTLPELSYLYSTMHGNQGKHRVTKRGPALSYPMFTLVTSEDIAGSGRAKYACAGAVAEDQKRTSCNIGGLSTALQNAVDKPLMPPSVRKTHCSGRKHKENVKDYYQKWMEEQAQSLIDKTTAAFQQGKIPPTPFAPPAGSAMIPPPPSLGGPPRPGMMPAHLQWQAPQ
ncbi:unnamed protein product [Ranitomeya imitator]|uniref:U1-C C2H2-type zinc finger domain-containing protein n=1 Tax=Ranitomeya imitator TaxID=111125 RepID=A0ABN9LDS9_9NEOB|nr:unnamed protein product [Ranitomeya imitator]